MSRSEKRQASVTLSFRLTPDEHEAIRAAAAMQGIGPTTLARRSAFAAASLPAPAYEQRWNPVSADLARVLGLLGRIASSANQLAKHANASQDIRDRVSVYALVDQLKHVRASLIGKSEAR